MLELQPHRPPVLAGRFEIMGILDGTGSTRQYLGWDAAEERWVIVRMPSFRAAHDSLARARFEREIRAHRQIDHPNVLKVIIADAAHPRFPWAATEIAEGGSVQDWMASHGAMPAYLAIDVMADVCSGLAAAHKAGLSHGAIRTRHVLINRVGTCLVSGLIGSGEQGDVQADVRGVGALLFTLLTGQPWDDGRAPALLAGLPSILSRAIERTRRGRGGYANVSSFSRDLEAAVLSLPMPDGTVPPLAGPEVALPDDPAQVWDPAARFPDLEYIAQALEDPDFEAPPEAFEREHTEETFASASPGSPAAPGSSASSPFSGGAPPIPYQMSRSLQGNEFKPQAYSRGDRPLYEEPPAPESNLDWGQWEPDEAPGEAAPRAAPGGLQIPEPLLAQLLALGGSLLALALAVTVFYGVRSVSEVRTQAHQAASALVAHVRTESELVYAMAHQGADRAALEEAYFAFAEARNEAARVDAAMAFAAEVAEQARAHGLDPASSGGTMSPLIQRIDEMEQLRANVLGARRKWADAAERFPGVVAVTLHLQARPPD